MNVRAKTESMFDFIDARMMKSIYNKGLLDQRSFADVSYRIASYRIREGKDLAWKYREDDDIRWDELEEWREDALPHVILAHRGILFESMATSKMTPEYESPG